MRTADWTESVSVLDRVSAVLDAFGDDEPLGVSEIARRANLPKSTVSRIVSDLVRERYLDRDGTHLSLGLRLFELGQAVERPHRLRQLAHPMMAQVRSLTGACVRLGVRDGDDLVVITTLSNPNADRHPLPAATRSALHRTALGRAILAYSSDAETTLGPQLRHELRAIRHAGFAVDVDATTGTSSVASAILAPSGTPVAALGIVGVDADVVPRLGDTIRSAAAAIARRVTP